MIGLRGATPRLPAVNPQAGTVALSVDLSVFALKAVLRAAHKLTDRSHLFVERPTRNDDRLVVTFRPKGDGGILETVVGDFANELIDQQLREQLAIEAGPIREILVAQAFAEGNLLDTDRDDGDYLRDPKAISGLRGKGPLAAAADPECDEVE